MKRAALLLMPALVAVLTGCQSTKIHLPRETRVPDGDLARAEALAHYAVGFLLSADANENAARDAFLRAHALDPSSAAPAEAAAQLLFHENRSRDVLDLLRDHARHAHAPAHAWYLLGKCAEVLDENQLAITAYTRALENPRDAPRLPIFIALVRASFNAGQDALALKLMRKEAVQNRDFMRAIANIWTYKFDTSNDPLRAAKLANFAASLANSRVEHIAAKRIEARALERAGRPRDAEKILLNLLPPYDEPATPVAIDLGKFYARTGNTNAVLKLQKKHTPAQKPFHLLVAETAWNAWENEMIKPRLQD